MLYVFQTLQTAKLAEKLRRSAPTQLCGAALCLSCKRRPVGGDVVRVQIAVAVGVLIEVEQLQPGFELAGQLFVRGVGELDAAVVLLQSGLKGRVLMIFVSSSSNA